MDRCLPYWEEAITPALQRGKTVLVAAHGNSIRGMLKHLDQISDEDITALEIPTGVPLVYNLDKDLRPIKVTEMSPMPHSYALHDGRQRRRLPGPRDFLRAPSLIRRPLNRCNALQAEGAVAPLTGRFLVDEDELRRKQEEVANQSKLRYGELEEGATAAAA